jgi:hypothetical protein
VSNIHRSHTDDLPRVSFFCFRTRAMARRQVRAFAGMERLEAFQRTLDEPGGKRRITTPGRTVDS